jgi:hypothetical protein
MRVKRDAIIVSQNILCGENTGDGKDFTGLAAMVQLHRSRRIFNFSS